MSQQQTNFTAVNFLGQGLLWIGFLGAAVASVLRLENSSNPWSTIPWMMYAAFAAVGVAGVIVLRRQKQAAQRLSAASLTGLSTVLEKLQECSNKIDDLRLHLDDLTCEEVLEYIDLECTPALYEFAEGREVIANRCGLTSYAMVMTEFASGERYLNRAWSAAADGYVDEVIACVGHSATFLQAAVREADKGLYQSPATL
jgi:hypothetical protein